MTDILDRLDHELATHRNAGAPEALAFHVSAEIAEESARLMMNLLSHERAERGVTMQVTDGRPNITYRGLQVIPQDLPAQMVLILGDSPFTRTLLGLAETDLNPRRAAQRIAFVGNAVSRARKLMGR